MWANGLRFAGFNQPTNPRLKGLTGKEAVLVTPGAKDLKSGFVLRQYHEKVTVNAVTGHQGREIAGFKVPAHIPYNADRVDCVLITHQNGRAENILVGEYADGRWQKIPVCMAESGKRLLKKDVKAKPYGRMNANFKTMTEMVEDLNLFHPANQNCYPPEHYS